MIPRAYITEWRQHAPWTQDAQVEQDLVLSRALVEIFRRPELADALAFRGGTALYKLHVRPPARYSEDIDLVQREAGPIGPTLNAIRAALDPWLGAPKSRRREARVTLVYRMISEGPPAIPMRLKIEINSREHFSVYGFTEHEFSVNSRWFSGTASVSSYELDELLGTKLRALYQRKKGRDLFDLAAALKEGRAAPDRIVSAFRRYMDKEGKRVSRAEFEENLHRKISDPSFLGDITPLLSEGAEWRAQTAFSRVLDELIRHLPGEPWRGSPDRAAGQ